MKNGSNARSKTSKIAVATNGYIIITMVFQFSLSLIAALITSFWTYNKGAEYWYLYPGDTNDD